MNGRGGLDRHMMGNGRGRSHRESVERGARIAEMGSLIPRSRAGSQSLGTTFETADSAE